MPSQHERRADDTRDTTTHRQVNRADAPACAVCGRRIILGRDGAPVTTPDGPRHAVCPPVKPALSCGHRAVYRQGPDKGACRACTRKDRRR
jgi:hypothetical protein